MITAFLVMQVLIMTTVSDNSLPPAIFSQGQRVLFQGDSITDMGRGRNDDLNHIMGHGYAFLIAARYGASYPDKGLAFINRGVSGDKAADLAGRWQTDTLDHQPDVLSILIGVNDIGFSVGANQPFSIEEYEKTYDKLLADAREVNPKVRFVLGEPFILPGQHTSDQWDAWLKAVRQMQAVVAKQDVPKNYWIWDGIHPTGAGHQLMADAWVRTYKAFYELSVSDTKRKK
jgi:lysophospholipase L1-like esterase